MKDYSLHSGERYSEIDLGLIGWDHIVRYSYVARVINENHLHKFGADIFCGSGYGAAMLARETDSTILAIDGSEEAISNANQKLQYSNLIYAQKFFPFELPASTFDFVASMESLEHVREQEAFFYTLQNSLKKNGQLFISAPNESVMPLGDYKWHFKHFHTYEIEAWASKYGLKVQNIFSTKCMVIDNVARKVIDHPDAAYPFQLENDRLFPPDVGDTNLYHLLKI